MAEQSKTNENLKGIRFNVELGVIKLPKGKTIDLATCSLAEYRANEKYLKAFVLEDKSPTTEDKAPPKPGKPQPEAPN